MAIEPVDANDAVESLGKLAQRLPQRGGTKALFVLIGVVVAAGALFGGFRVVIDRLDLDTPLAGAVQIGVVVAGVAATIVASLRMFTTRSTKLGFIVIGATLALFVIGSIALIVTDRQHELHPGEPVRASLQSDQERTHHFEVETGDRAVVTLEESARLDASLNVEQDNMDFAGSPAGPGRLRVDETLPAGRWDVVVDSADGTSGAYTLRLAFDRGRALPVGRPLTHERIVDETDTNGYRVRSARAAVLTLTADHLSSGFTPVIQVSSGGFIRGQAKTVNGTAAVTIEARAGQLYLVVVRGDEASTGEYELQLQPAESLSPGDLAGVTSRVTAPALTARPQEPVAVPDVYDALQADAESVLIAAGFSVRSFPVCSHSVAAGHVRQVSYQGSSGDVVVIDKPGVGVTNVAPRHSKLEIKVGTGAAC